MSAIHIGDKVYVQIRVLIRLKRGSHHRRPQVRTADTDIDYIRYRFPGISAPLTGPKLIADKAHFIQLMADCRHHILAIQLDGCCRHVAQCRM